MMGGGVCGGREAIRNKIERKTEGLCSKHLSTINGVKGDKIFISNDHQIIEPSNKQHNFSLAF
jgi:hypothetical protein